jgi:hypothetical protein
MKRKQPVCSKQSSYDSDPSLTSSIKQAFKVLVHKLRAQSSNNILKGHPWLLIHAASNLLIV